MRSDSGAFGRRTGRARCFLLGALWTYAACGDAEKPKAQGDVGPPPVQLECDADNACKTGSLCAEGRCYRACRGEDDCSDRERCETVGALSGLCVAGDAGLPADPCDQAACLGDTPVCHPTSGVCVACTEAEHCSGERPICDRGKGRCVAREAALCAPCNADADCRLGDAGVSLACVTLTQTSERACLPSGCSADSDCPETFECLPSLNACVPRRGSCTAYRAASAGLPCDADLDCSSVGLLPASPYAGVCDGQQCAFACAATRDCPAPQTCTVPMCVNPVGVDAGGTATGDGGV